MHVPFIVRLKLDAYWSLLVQCRRLIYSIRYNCATLFQVDPVVNLN